MFRSIVFFCVILCANCGIADAQQCNEYFDPSHFVASINADGVASIEFSVDCFRIPPETWGPDSPLSDRELFTQADLVLTGNEWWEIGRLEWGAGAGSGRVLDENGQPLRVESQTTLLDNGRALSTALIPALAGLQAEAGEVNGGPVTLGEELFMLWRANVDPSVGIGGEYYARFEPSLFVNLPFSVVPEPSSVNLVGLACVAVFLFRRNRKDTV